MGRIAKKMNKTEWTKLLRKNEKLKKEIKIAKAERDHLKERMWYLRDVAPKTCDGCGREITRYIFITGGPNIDEPITWCADCYEELYRDRISLLKERAEKAEAELARLKEGK